MIGSKLAHYEITSHLGTGGMGEVYRAADSKLGRSVAIKLLPAAFASDPDRLSRFRREAQLLASLNHPNIAHVYGLEEIGETRCIVMELVEGETLQARIQRGPIPVSEALVICRQIAEALVAAHEKGVVHRDLKPGNVMLTVDGSVRVLDFGLAKAYETNSANASLTNSPTLASMAATNAGVIMGTAAYMSPEQAKGIEADRRADVFSFGAVLFEMITGHQAFEGDSVSEVLAGVLKVDPDWNRLPKDTPPAIRRLLERCLRKDRNRRVQTALDLRNELEEMRSEAIPVSAPLPAFSRRREKVWAVVAALGILAAAGLAVRTYFAPKPEVRTVRFDLFPPAGGQIVGAGGGFLSPDGRNLAFVMTTEGKRQIWIRPLDSSGAQPLSGTEDAASPFWSPDSRHIAFFAQGKLKKVAVAGGPAQFITTQEGRDGTWGSKDTILIGGSGGPLLKVSAAGGQLSPATELDASQKETTHDYPDFLPDGQHFLYMARNGATPDNWTVYVGNLDSKERHALPGIHSAAKYSTTGHVLFYREGTLMAQGFDLKNLQLSGEAFPIAEEVALGPNPWFSASENGSLAYQMQSSASTQLAWFDRSGRPLGTLGDAARFLNGVSLSLDGKKAAVFTRGQGNADVWIIDAARTSRFTFDAGLDQYPLWSPDGSQILFDSNRKGVRNLYLKSSNGAGNEQLLLESPLVNAASDWSRDGRFILYIVLDPKTNTDTWVLPLQGERKPFAFLNSNAVERGGQFSPDGRWVAYQSNESGKNEIYVRPFPGPGGQWLVSTGGGVQVRWSRDGKELYYIAPDGKLMAVPVVVKGAAFEPGTPEPLFQTRIAGGGANSDTRQHYDVTTDGRFLIHVTAENAEATPITVILNWKPQPQ